MVIAKQIPPEEQNVDFAEQYDVEEEGIIIESNTRFRGYNDEIVDDAKRLLTYIDNEYDVDPDEFALVDEQFEKLRAIANQKKTVQEIKNEFITEFISTKHGIQYQKFILRGCSQGEWIFAWLPADSSSKYVSDIAATYFNEGSEFIIDEDIRLYVPSVYSEDIKKAIADYMGVDVSDVRLYLFDGWKRTPKYKAV